MKMLRWIQWMTALSVVMTGSTKSLVAQTPYLVPFQPDLQSAGGRAAAVSINPTHPLMAIAACDSGGLFMTFDGGSSWWHVFDCPMHHMSDVKFAPGSPPGQVVVIATSIGDGRTDSSGGIWRSIDGGFTWHRPENYNPGCSDLHSAYGIAFSPDGARVYVGTDCGIAIGLDYGETWVHQPEPSASGVAVWSIATQRGDGEDIVDFFTPGVTYKRLGVDPALGIRDISSVRPPGSSQPGFCVHGIAIPPTQPSVVFVAAKNGLYEGDYDTAEHVTWTQVNPTAWGQITLKDGVWRNPSRGAWVAITAWDRGNPGIYDVYASDGYRLFRQTCNPTGLTGSGCTPTGWLPVDAPPIEGASVQDLNGMAFRPDTGLPAYVAGDRGLYTATRAAASSLGLQWQLVRNGGRHGFAALQIYQVTGQIIPARHIGSTWEPGHTDLYFGTQDNRFWASDDGGVHWPYETGVEGGFIKVPRSAPSSHEPRSSGRNIVMRAGAIASEAYYQNEQDWKPFGLLTDAHALLFIAPKIYLQAGIRYGPCDPLSVGPCRPFDFYLLQDLGASGQRVATSWYDGGGSMQASISGNQVTIYRPIQRGDGTRGLQILTGIHRDGTVTLPPPPQAPLLTFHDADGGDSGLVNLGFTGREFGWDAVFAVDPHNPWSLLAVDVGTQQVKSSRTWGATWQPDDQLTDLVTGYDPATGQRAFKFQYEPWPGGLFTQITAITFDPTYPGRILVGTESAGIFMSTDRGTSWTAIPSSAQAGLVTSFFFIENHIGEPADTVIVSTWERGLWKLIFPPDPPAGSSLARMAEGNLSAMSVNDGPFLLSSDEQTQFAGWVRDAFTGETNQDLFLRWDAYPHLRWIAVAGGNIQDISLDEFSRVQGITVDGGQVAASSADGRVLSLDLSVTQTNVVGAFDGCPACASVLQDNGSIRGLVLEDGTLRAILAGSGPLPAEGEIAAFVPEIPPPPQTPEETPPIGPYLHLLTDPGEEGVAVVGDLVSLNGTGFCSAPGCSGVDIQIGEMTVVQGVPLGTNGDFQITFAVPELPSGEAPGTRVLPRMIRAVQTAENNQTLEAQRVLLVSSGGDPENEGASAPPRLESAGTLDGRILGVCFDQAITEESASNAANYQVQNGTIPVVDATLRSDRRSVQLTLAGSIQLGGNSSEFTVTATNILNLASNVGGGTVTGVLPANAWTTADLGQPMPPGSVFSCESASIEIISGGRDVWDSSDRFTMVSRPLTGDFDVWVHVIPVTGPGGAIGGLLARESISDPGAKSVGLFLMPDPNAPPNYLAASALVRSVPGQNSQTFGGADPAGLSPLPLFRLQRVGNVFTTFHSGDGINWQRVGQTDTSGSPFAETLLVGFGAASPRSNQTATVEFRDWMVAQPGCLVLTCPTNMVLDCTDSLGTVATYSVMASNLCYPENPVTLLCDPPSGTRFPPGTWTVDCLAISPVGVEDKTNHCSFTVTVNSNCPPAVPSLVAWEPFEYPDGSSLTTPPQNGGVGWAGPWLPYFGPLTTRAGTLVPPAVPGYVTSGGHVSADTSSQISRGAVRPLDVAASNGPVWVSCVMSSPARSPEVFEWFGLLFDGDSQPAVYIGPGGANTNSNSWILNQIPGTNDPAVDPNVPTLLVLEIVNSPNGLTAYAHVNPLPGVVAPPPQASLTLNNFHPSRLTGIRLSMQQGPYSGSWRTECGDLRVASTFGDISGANLTCPNRLVNGSFETPGVPDLAYGRLYGGDELITGWKTLDDGVDYYNPALVGGLTTVPDVSTGLAADGFYALNLSPIGGTGGGIRQTFPTTPGNTYHVFFKMGTSAERGRTGPANLTARITTDVTPPHEFPLPADSAQIAWELMNFDFTATKPFSTLVFTSSDDPATSFVNLDDVHVIECPPPFCIDDVMCPPVTAECTNGGAYVEFQPTAINRCHPTNEVAVVCDPPSGSFFTKGHHSVHCTFTSPGADPRTRSFDVWVRDSLPPVIRWEPDKTVECGSGWEFDPPDVQDACCTNFIIEITGGTTNQIPPGQDPCHYEYTRSWKVTDCDGVSYGEGMQTVTGFDTTPPQLTCPRDRIVRVDGSGSPLPAFSRLYSFTGSLFPPLTTSLVEGRDGVLYGTTDSGGRFGRGAVFKVNKDGSLPRVLFDFDPTPTPEGWSIVSPFALLEGRDGMLYGICQNADLFDAIFKLNKVSGDLSFVSDPDLPLEGVTSLIEGRSDAFLYGGSIDGIVFKLGLDASIYNSYLFPHGEGPNTILEGSDGALYCTTLGGSHHHGTVFKLDDVLTLIHPEVLVTFGDRDGDGDFPTSLIEGSDGMLYGTTADTRAGFGTIFRVGKDAPADPWYVYRFAGPDGVSPRKLIEGRDGNRPLYVVTCGDGILSRGTIFQVNKDGFDPRVLFSFDEPTVCPSTLIQGSDGALYGTDSVGVFRFDPQPAWDLQQPTAVDACFGAVTPIEQRVTNGLCPQVITRTWTATDCAGNTTNCSQTVTLYGDCPALFGGLTNSPIGSAIVEVVPNPQTGSSQLLVHNFSNMGTDGVGIHLNAAQFGGVGFECLDPGALPDGADLTFRAIGQVNHTNDQVVATFQAVDVGNDIEYHARFDALGDVPLLAVLYDGESAVGTVRIPSPPDFTTFARVSGAAGDARITPYMPQSGHPAMVLEWPAARPMVTLTGGSPVYGTRLVVTPDLTKVSFPDRPLEFSNDVVNAGLNFWWEQPVPIMDPVSIQNHVFIGPISRLEVLAAFVPEVVILSEEVGMFGLAHHSVGGALLNGLGDLFKVTPVTNQPAAEQGFDIIAGDNDEWGSGTGAVEVEWLHLNPPGGDAALRAGLIDPGAGGSNEFLASLEVRQTGPNTLTTAVIPFTVGDEYQVEVRSKGLVVASTLISNNIAATFSQWPTMFHFAPNSPGPGFITPAPNQPQLSYGWNSNISINLSGVGSVTGNELRVWYTGVPVVIPFTIKGLGLRFGGLPELEVIREAAFPAGLVYQGLAHESISNATLGVLGSDLVISNSANAASFGASVVLGDSSGATLTLDGRDLSGAPEGSSVELLSHGSVDGVPDQPISRLRVSNFGNGLRISADYSTLGATGITAVVLDGSRVADATEVFLATDIEPAQRVHLSSRATWASGRELKESIGFDDRLPISLNAKPPVLGDHILLTPQFDTSTAQSSGPIGTISRVALVGTGLPSFRITDEEPGKFLLEHHALGQATLLAMGDWMRVGNLASGDDALDGVEFSLAGKDTFSAFWRPLDRFGEVSPGAIVQASLVTAGAQSFPWLQMISVGAQKEIRADFSALGVSSCLVEVRQSNEVVSSTSVPAVTGVAAQATDWPIGVGAGRDSNNPSNIYASWIWISPETFTVAGQAVVGDELRINAFPTGPGLNVSSIRLQASGLPDLRIVYDATHSGAPITTGIQTFPGGILAISWDTSNPGQKLQSADDPHGLWQDVPGATTSPYLLVPKRTKQFIRVFQR
jgi:uncharacterized repeat protein (TIGR03803 family)